MFHTLVSASLLQLALTHALDCHPILAYYRNVATAETDHVYQCALRAAHDREAAAVHLGDAEARALFTGTVLVLDHAVRPRHLPWKTRLAWDLLLAGITRREVERPVALAADLLYAFGPDGEGEGAPLRTCDGTLA